HEVIIDTTSKDPVVSNDRNVGRTFATYKKADGKEYTDTDLAVRPGPASVSKGVRIPFQPTDPCCIVVEITGESGNPLVKGSPPIQYYYKLVFDLVKNELRYAGTHTPYPWHELYVSEVGSLHQYIAILNEL